MKNSLVIILFDHPREHTSDYASQTAKFFSKDNVVIELLLKDARSIKETILTYRKAWFWKRNNANSFAFKPLYIIPFRRFKFIERANIVINIAVIRLIISILLFHRKVKNTYLWVFNPESYLALKLFGSSVFSIYDCVDYHGDDDTYYSEKQLIRTCDIMFVNSHALYDIHHKLRPDVYLVPLGFDLNSFSVNHAKSYIKLAHSQPIIGYVGGINSRLDYLLLLDLVQKNAWLNFVFVGPIQKHESHDVFETLVKPKIDTLYSFPNVYYLQYVSKDMIPGIISQFDICTIPYNTRLAFNKYCYPMKLFEYYYMGKPVISTPIDELKRFPKYVKIGRTAKGWETSIKEILSKSWPIGFQNEQKRLAVENSWERKIGAIIKYISQSDRLKNR